MNPAPPAGSTNQSNPANFSEALVAARTEINNLYPCSRESASLTHNLATVQVHEFMSTANSLLAQPTVSEVDRSVSSLSPASFLARYDLSADRSPTVQDLMKAAQALKAYFSIVEAISRTHSDVHLNFMQASVVSLIAVSSSRAGPDLEARQLALAAETATKETRLAVDIAPVGLPPSLLSHACYTELISFMG